MTRRKLFSLLGFPALLAGTAGAARLHAEANPYHDGPPTDHFDGVRFFQPDGPSDKGLAELLRWQLGGGREPWPDHYPSPFTDRPPERTAGLRVALIGHASFLIQVAGLNLLVDPVYAERVSPVSFAGPRRVNPPGIVFDHLPPIDAVLVTHNHYDHCDGDTLGRLVGRFASPVMTPLGNDAVIRPYAERARIETLDWGQEIPLSDKVGLHCVPALHWSARGLNDRRMALWSGFVLTTPAGLIYVAGDTGLGDGGLFREIRARFGPPRVAILPIGAYEPRWFMRAQHMNPEDAVRAFGLLEAGQALGCHWGTFRLTNEGIDRPVHDLAIALADARIPPERFPALRPGQVWEG